MDHRKAAAYAAIAAASTVAGPYSIVLLAATMGAFLSSGRGPFFVARHAAIAFGSSCMLSLHGWAALTAAFGLAAASSRIEILFHARHKRRLQRDLDELGMSQADLARLTGKSRLQVNRWIRSRHDSSDVPGYVRMIIRLLKELPAEVRKRFMEKKEEN